MISPKDTARLRLFERLLMSHYDFHHAYRIASYILDHRLQDKVGRLSGKRRYRIKLLWEALNSAMIIAYCRPFSGNDRRTLRKIPDLPARFFKGLTSEETEIHEAAIEDRNTLLAHSDSDAWNMRIFFQEVAPGRRLLVPVSHDVRAPLIHDAVYTLRGICGKVMDQISAERRDMERELAHFLPVVTTEEMILDAIGTHPLRASERTRCLGLIKAATDRGAITPQKARKLMKMVSGDPDRD
jgi:hypothetical protein